jgi:formylglycine-generating enzyme required for sulfatase activity
MDLTQTLAALRRGQGLAAGRKVLLVLDQFEQWLHARREEANPELIGALRQCDGERLQAIVLVRDDFWMAATRFMRELEVRLLEGENSAAVDLFDLHHARKVLAAFGRAFGRLPETPTEMTREQKQFLEQAVAGLAQEGKVISVRLALFAEMVKGREWTPATLKGVGGMQGVGVTFLEETFSASTAPPQHRLHQAAARAVLKALLPEQGSDIKGHMRAQQQLLEASGYSRRPRDFDDLLRILDHEVRLITPTDPEGAAHEASRERQRPESQPADTGGSPTRYYQLTHDYLVPSLHSWLTRKQRETRRGRAELRLEERAAAWSARPENRSLPAWWEWASIRLLTRKAGWTSAQQKMMHKATRYHAVQALVLAACLALLGWGGWEGFGRLKAQALRDRLLNADTADVPTIVNDMAGYRRWIDPLLREAYRQAETSQQTRQQLHAGLALLPVDSGQVDYLHRRLLDAAPPEVPVLRDALLAHKQELREKLWTVVEQPTRGQEHQRLRAACALARYDPDSPRWAKVQDAIANDLVRVPAVHLATWMDSLRPLHDRLLAPLAVVFRDARRRETERSLATDVLADYAGDQPGVLADLLLDADDKQFTVLYPKLHEKGEGGLTLLLAQLDRKLPANAREDAREKLARQQANAAVALLRMGQPERVWPLLAHSPDPRRRSYLIHRLGPLGADPGTIIKRLDEEPDATIRRALLWSLGELEPDRLSLAERAPLIPKLLRLYREDPDPGLHGATEWLLRQWNQQGKIKEIDRQLVKERDQRLGRIHQQLASGGRRLPQPRWYVNGQGQTMVVIPGPVTFLMGSPPTEAGRYESEWLHPQRIGRSFAIAAKPVTVEQSSSWLLSDPSAVRHIPTRDCPVPWTTWYGAAAYCNWLSKQEGLPDKEWCYEPNKEGKYEAGMKLAPDYLKRTGYRLPTEAEWEFACRAGAVTSRYYGESDELLAKYARYLDNSANQLWPVGSLKSNDLGLFDMHGNVWQWCQERLHYHLGQGGKAMDDKEDSLIFNDRERRAARGGSFVNPADYLRCAGRLALVPSISFAFLGFRVARTIR